MSLPQCIQGCPQHETRVRHKQRHRSRTVSKTSSRGEAGQAHASPGDFGEGCAQHESMQPLTLLPHKTRSKLSRSGQANPGFEGGQGGSGRPGLFRGGCRAVPRQGSRGVGGIQGKDEGGGAGGPGSTGVWGVQRFWAEKRLKTRKNQKNAPELYGPSAQQHPGFCAGGSSRPNGSGYPLCPPPPINVHDRRGKGGG